MALLEVTWKNHVNEHEGYGYGIRNKEREKDSWFLSKHEHDSRNNLFQKRANLQVTYEPGPSKT